MFKIRGVFPSGFSSGFEKSLEKPQGEVYGHGSYYPTRV